MDKVVHGKIAVLLKGQSDICMIVPDVDHEAGDEGNHELDEDGHDTKQPNIHQLFFDQ